MGGTREVSTPKVLHKGVFFDLLPLSFPVFVPAQTQGQGAGLACLASSLTVARGLRLTLSQRRAPCSGGGCRRFSERFCIVS